MGDANGQTVAVICSLEQIPWWTKDSDSVWFGLNISAAYLEIPGPARPDVLLPWKWWMRPSGKLQVQWSAIQDGVRVFGIGDEAGVDNPSCANGELRKLINTLGNGAEMAMAEYSQPPCLPRPPKPGPPCAVAGTPPCALPVLEPTPLTWSPNENPARFDGQRLPRLCDRLAELSTAPFPIPQELNLSFVFKIRRQDLKGIQSLIARPIWRPTNSLAPEVLSGGIHRWRYTGKEAPVPSFDYMAFVQPVQVPPQECDFNIDPHSDTVDWNTGWIRSQGGSGQGDWLSSLRGRLADAFDLPQRLIDMYRERHDQFGKAELVGPACAWQPSPRWFRNAVLFSLWELINPGTAEDHYGRTLVDDLMPDLPKADRDNVVKVLKQWPDPKFASPIPPCAPGTNWEQTITAAISSAQVPSMANVPQDEGDDAAHRIFAGALQDLHDRCLHPDNLPALILEQWSRAFAAPSGDPSLWNKIRQRVRDGLARIPLRPRLLQINLDAHWDKILQAIHNETMRSVLLFAAGVAGCAGACDFPAERAPRGAVQRGSCPRD
jgi:hypothetical protein